jgi:hypothetical protein
MGTQPTEMTTANERLQRFALYVLAPILVAVVLMTVIFSNIQTSTSRHFCAIANENRQAINQRGSELREFLRTAAISRRDAGDVFISSGDAEQAKINYRAAARWTLLANEIHALTLPTC